MRKKLSVLSMAAVLIGGSIAVLTGCSLLRSERPLTGTEWTLQLNSLTGMTSMPEQPLHPVTLEITADGEVTGSGGVNRYRSQAEVTPATTAIVFGAALSTRMAGPGMACEQAFFTMLRQVRYYRIDGDRLYLQDGERRDIAVFIGAAPQPPQP